MALFGRKSSTSSPRPGTGRPVYEHPLRPYLQHMLSSTSDSFSDMVIIGERVEMCIKVRTISGASGTNGNNNSGGGKKMYSSGFVKKKEGEVSNASDDKGKAIVQVPYYQTPATAP